MSLSVPPRSVRPEAIPAVRPVEETHKERHPHLLLRLSIVVVLIVATAVGGVTAWRQFYGPGLTHPVEDIFSNAMAAYQNEQFEKARALFLKAAGARVERAKFVRVRNTAESLIPLAEAQLALNKNDFKTAQSKLREAEKRGVDAGLSGALQQKIWKTRDVWRLKQEGEERLASGDLSGLESTLDEYERTASAAGLELSDLRKKLQQTRDERKYDQAMKRSQTAFENKDYDKALRSLLEAERVKQTSESRELAKRIKDSKKRANWVLQGDKALRDRDFVEAAAAYETANRIDPTPEIERKARIAGAYVLYEEASAAINEGALLRAERNLRTSIWKYRTREAMVRLERMAPVFAAARLARKADRLLKEGQYAEAVRLYERALPHLPEPAHERVKGKLAQARRAANGHTTTAP